MHPLDVFVALLTVGLAGRDEADDVASDPVAMADQQNAKGRAEAQQDEPIFL